MIDLFYPHPFESPEQNSVPLSGRLPKHHSQQKVQFLKDINAVLMNATLNAGIAGSSEDSDIEVNWGGDKPLIHYRLIEVNAENPHPAVPPTTIFAADSRSPELISKTMSKYYYYRSSAAGKQEWEPERWQRVWRATVNVEKRR